MHHDSWPNSTPPSSDLAMMIGELRADTRRMLTVTDRMDSRLDTIDQRLAHGSAVMGDLSRRLSVIEARPEPPPPAWERHGKQVLAYALPVLVLWLTGNIDMAKQALTLTLGGGK